MYLGLHVGEVFYGIGSRDRLDFTVVGPAVNEARRIAAMSRSVVDQPVLMSAAFADVRRHQAPPVSVGRYALRCVAPPGAVHARSRGVRSVVEISPNANERQNRRCSKLIRSTEGECYGSLPSIPTPELELWLQLEPERRPVARRVTQRDAVPLTATYLRLALVPPRRDRPVHFVIPTLSSSQDATRAMAAITTAVASGELTPTEAAELSRVIESYVRAIEATEIERRLRLLEERGRRDAK
jgi:hypothetical protein